MIKRLFSQYIAEEARPMLRLALPLVLAELGWMTMAIVDTMMVGRQADSAVAIGAVSLGSILFNSAAIFGTGLMLGLDTLVSHSYGAGDVEDCHRSLVNGVYLSLAISPILMGVVWLFRAGAAVAGYTTGGFESGAAVFADAELGNLAAATVFCVPTVSAGNESGQAGDVRADLRQLY